MSDLANSIWQRYGWSPGVVPLDFARDLAGRAEADRLPLLEEVQRRWTGQYVDAAPVRWPVPFEAVEPSVVEDDVIAELADPARIAIAELSPALPAAIPAPAAPFLQRKAQRMAASPFPLVSKTPQLPSAPSESAPVQFHQPVPVVGYVPKAAPPPDATIEAPRAVQASQPDVVIARSRLRPAAGVEKEQRSGLPVVRLREAPPKILLQARMANAGVRSSAPASSAQPMGWPAAWSSTAGARSLPAEVSTAAVRASAPQNESPAAQAANSPASKPPEPIDAEQVADRAMHKMLRRLAIERERRGGPRWP
jgi:hypothetical protein